MFFPNNLQTFVSSVFASDADWRDYFAVKPLRDSRRDKGEN